MYLQQHPSVAINGFGRFYIDNQAVYNEDPDKPSKAHSPVRFEHNPGIVTDLDFIDFVMKETGKIRPLAIADLESYTSLARQLLNISKPFVIEGVGTLVSDNRGGLDFTPGNFEPPKLTPDNDREKKLRKANDVPSDRDTETGYGYGRDDDRGGAGFNVKKMLLLFVAAAVLGVAGWAVYEYVLNKKDNAQKVQVKENETAGDKGVAKDTSTLQKDTSRNKTAMPLTPDGSVFRLVIKQIASKAEATAYLKKFVSRGHSMIMVAAPDSSSFTMKLRINRPIADTATARDSVRKFYFPKEKVYIEL
jgi:hypothetical protein